MNSSRNNHGAWILCPSKSFRGKFYYFNVQTGETAWSLNETETKNVKKDTIHRVTDKLHSYPEPMIPPEEEVPKPANCFLSYNNPKFDYNAHKKQSSFQSNSSPSFGQAVFPNYFPNQPTSNIVWATIQIPTPMFIPNVHGTKAMLDQVTQTYQPERELFVHSSSVPLCTRFQNLQRTIFNVNSQENYFQSTNFSSKTQTEPTQNPTGKFAEANSNSNLFSLNYSQQFSPQMFAMQTDCTVNNINKSKPGQKFVPAVKKLANESVKITQTELYTPKPTLKRSESCGNLADLVDIEEATLIPSKKVQSPTKQEKICDLDKNDLRFLLMARRRKSVDVILKDEDANPTPTTSKINNVAQKKHVTFNLEQNQGDNKVSSIELVTSTQREHEPMHDTWYVAVDTVALLEELQLMEFFVKQDENCRLLVPYVVKSEIESQSRSESITRQTVLAARQVVRRLDTALRHIIVQSEPSYEASTPEDSIVLCCWQLLKENYRVVLITNNTNLQKKAKCINLICYKIDEVKEGVFANEPSFDNNIKIVTNNFGKNVKTPLMFPDNKTEQRPINKSGRNMLENKNCEEIDGDRFFNFKRDANTSPILMDPVELFANPETKSQNSTKIMSEIDLNIRDLNINDRSNRLLKGEKYLQKDFTILKHNKGNMQITGIVKLNNGYNLNDDMKRYYVKNKLMADRIIERKEEWMCCLTQVMEDALTDFLLNEDIPDLKISAPWNFNEAIKIIGENFRKNSNIKVVVDKLSILLNSCSSGSGKLKNIQPKQFIELLGLCIILIKFLIEFVSNPELNHAEELLQKLLRNVEDPSTDIDFPKEAAITPVMSKSELNDEPKTQIGLKKTNRSHGIFKKHFDAWKSCDVEREIKVVRTCGRDLKKLKILGSKFMTVDGKQSKNTVKILENKQIMRKDKFNKASNSGFYEDQLLRKSNEIIDLDKLDYEMVETLSSLSSSDNSKGFNTQNTINLITDESLMSEKTKSRGKNTIHATIGIEDIINMDDSNDFEKESSQAYSLIKTFLEEISTAFKVIFKFIHDNMNDFRGDSPGMKKMDIQQKVEMVQKSILCITENLKGVIERESGTGTTLKKLLIHAGDCYTDKRMARYKQVIRKCLEQALILESALKIMRGLSDDSIDLTDIVIDEDIRYFNIYEPSIV